MTTLSQIFDNTDAVCCVAESIPDDSVHFGMLASVNRQFNLKFKSFAEQTKKYREDTKLFVELRDFIIDDLTSKSGYIKEDDEDNDEQYNDETPENYWTMFYREDDGGILYLMRKTMEHHVSVSASNFRWEDFDVGSKEEWAQFSPLMALPGPFKLVNGAVVPMSEDEAAMYSSD